MNPIARGNVEIMVHTTAPSLGRDDARYRKLAQAYLDFQPAQRHRLGEDRLRLDSQQAGNEQHENIQQKERDSDASWQPDEIDHESISQQHPLNDLDILDITELLSSPELSFSGVEDNRASPAFRAPITWRHPDSQKSAEESWKRPGSEVPDSQPERINPVLAEFSSPTRILEVFLQNRDSSSSGPSTKSQRYPDSLQRLVSSQNNSRIHSSQSQDQDKGSLEVRLSSEERSSSSQSLPHHRNEVQGSPELGVDRSSPIVSLQSDRLGEAPSEKSTRDEGIGSKKSHSNHQSSSQHGAENSLPFGVTRQGSLQSSQPRISNSSPSPPKRNTKQPGQALGDKSPNPPIIQNQQPSKKRNVLNTIAETAIPSSAPSALALSEAPSPRPTKKQRLEPASSPINPITITNTPSTSNLPTPSSLSTPSKTTIWTSKLEIHPPLPKTSTATLTSSMLITPKLHAMAQKMPLSSFFHAKAQQSRELRPMERGYWLINCTSWTEEVRYGCWNFLGEVIGKGSAGWGVWCVRDGDGDEDGDEGGLKSFRVYCWGIVVGHLWLVLKVASLNKVVKGGACWVAGDGEVVVRMGEDGKSQGRS